MSLRRRFIAVFVAFTVVLTAAGGWLTWRTARSGVERELDEKLKWTAGAVAETGLDRGVMSAFREGDEEDPLWEANWNRLRRLRRYVDEAYIFGRDRRALMTTDEPEVTPIGTPLRVLELFPDVLEEAWQTGEATSPLYYHEEDGWLKYGFVRIGQSETMLGVRARADFGEPLASLRTTIIIGSLVGAMIAALIAGLLAATVIEPLERLGRVAIRIQRGRLDEPVGEERGEELGRLSRAMERMRVGIHRRDEQLRLMLAQVAHEIRNPLGGLELFAAAAAETEDPQERIRVLGRVRAEVVALNQIIDDFLVFARPMEPLVAGHDVREPVRDAVELIRPVVESEGGEVTLDLPNVSLMVHADPEHVKRLVLNLLRNASQAGQKVGVRAEWLEGEVRISVRDDGPGVDPSVRDRIFEPFVTDKAQGAGLGLAIVRRVAEVNGGRVELAPAGGEYGEGAEFRVYFSEAEEIPAPVE